MTFRELIIYGQDMLKNAGILDFENDTKVLLMYCFNLNYTELMVKLLEEVPEEKLQYFQECIDKRIKHIPCQHITGVQEFMGYEFKVTPDVLIPRQETEILVEESLTAMNQSVSCKALDMCTGSGCIGISFFLERKSKGFDADVTLADISKEALEVANYNNKNLNADCKIIITDLFENITEKYDIIMSNPPYIKTSDIEELMDEVKLYDPRLALDGYEDGLHFYKKIIKEARNYLNYEGKLFFEIGHDQHKDVERLLIDAGYSDIILKKDYAGLDRVVIATYKKDGL
ncbi:MAG: peptide chain release factor N(5)-glutamine methyltransferase [Lachnospiraceae bacterium]|nr:peptide chain release factor N(5)-glutamine methyltransferase [Lachnospiraceae bacterium]